MDFSRSCIVYLFVLTPVVFEHVHFTLKCKTNQDKSKFITSKQLQFDYIYFSLITFITRLHGTFVDTVTDL